MWNSDNRADSSLSDDSPNEDMSDNDHKLAGLQRYQPRPPSAPMSEDSRQNRRRHHRISKQTQETSQSEFQSSKNTNKPNIHSKYRQQRQLESEMDSSQIDPYGSTTSLRQSGTSQLSKAKTDKISLPRPSSALGKELDDDKQHKKRRNSMLKTVRPARVSHTKIKNYIEGIIIIR